MTNALLDLDVMSRAEKVRFDLLDATGRVIGAVHPQRSVTVACDSTQQIKRKLTGFVLPADEAADVDVLAHRVKPYWVLDDGTQWPLGVFLFAEASRTVHTYGEPLTATLVDQGLILAQEIDRTVGFDAGTSASSAIAQVLELAGIYNAAISVSSAFTLGSPIAWPAGKSGTTWAKIVDDLAGKAGGYPCYFDADGRATVRTAADLSSAGATLDYSTRTIAGSITSSNDLLIAPNRFLAVDTSATTGAIVGTYDVPDTAPHSFARRGFRITKVVEAPGVGDVAQATAAAQAAYSSSPVAYAQASFSTPADPRAGVFDVVRLWDGNLWLETSWSLTCAPGGPMSHQATRVWA